MGFFAFLSTFRQTNKLKDLRKSISAVGAHLGSDPRWKVAVDVIIVANGKR
jgi:hypothetical protein